MWPFKKKEAFNVGLHTKDVYQLLGEISRNLYRYDGMPITEIVQMMPEKELRKYVPQTWFGACLILFIDNGRIARKLNEKNF